jgi:HK97 family phage major capsid protein
MELIEIIDAIQAQKDFINASLKGQADKGVEYENAVADLKAKVEELQRNLAPNTVSVPGVNEVKENFSWSKALYGIHTGDWDHVPFEKEVFDTTRKTAMETGTGTLGGYIVPVEYSAEIIEMLLARTVLDKLGISKMTNLTGLFEMPKQTGGATAYWVGENSDITESNLTFGMITAQPKQVAALVKTSDRLLRMSNPSVETVIKRDIALALALKTDLGGLRGSGTSTQPRGVANTTGINTVYASATSSAGNGGNISFDVLNDMEYALEEDNALFGELGYAWHPCIRRNLQKLKVAQYSGDTAGEYIVQPVTQDQLKAWLSYPFQATTQIPTNLTQNAGSNLTESYFGNWQELFMFLWGGIQIAVSNQTSDAFQKVQTWVRIIQDVDFAVRHPESFCICPDINKTNA